ncbi:hypothetical protein C8F01DRAFT_1178096 [Mycena amicta]|nr:hypothetical protein C8F01DRAFT_1178096 [Mycena amicta]
MSPSRPNYGTARGRGSSSSTSTANTCRYENAISAATHTKLVLPSGECLSNPSELVVTPNKRSSQPQACSASSVAPATWGYLLQHKSAIALTELSTIFVCVPEGPTAWFDELLQGVGGTRTHLAARIVGNMDFAVADSLDKPLPTHAVVQVQGLFLLSMRMRSRDPDLSDALACYELTNAMTRACRALSCATDLSAGPPTDRLDLLDIMAESLCSMCQSAAAPEEMCEALDTGLLKFFFSCAANEAMPRRMRKLQRFLRDAIPQFTILHSVLCSLEDALDEIKHLDAAAHFKFDDELLKDWNALVQLAHERFQVLDQYAAGSLTARRACDNRQCWKIFPKTSMKRCGGCCIRHYCSRACQKTDYLARHRNACPILREYYEGTTSSTLTHATVPSSAHSSTTTISHIAEKSHTSSSPSCAPIPLPLMFPAHTSTIERPVPLGAVSSSSPNGTKTTTEN